MLEVTRTTSGGSNGKIMASVSSSVISAAHLISRKSMKESLAPRLSKPKFPSAAGLADWEVSHNSCSGRTGQVEYPLCVNVTEFEMRSCLATSVARAWVLLGKPSRRAHGQAEGVQSFQIVCQDLPAQDAEHIRCMLLQCDERRFKDLLDFIPAACNCDSVFQSPSPKERMQRSASTLDASAMISSQPITSPLSTKENQNQTTIVKRGVLNYLAKRTSVRHLNTDSADRQSLGSSSKGATKRMWSKAGQKATLQAPLTSTGSLPSNKLYEI
eukprot:scpid83012/ scgid19124/ 